MQASGVVDARDWFATVEPDLMRKREQHQSWTALREDAESRRMMEIYDRQGMRKQDSDHGARGVWEHRDSRVLPP